MRVPFVARVRAGRGPLAGIIVGVAIGVVGFFLGFVASPGSAQDAALIDTAFVPDKASLDSLAPETVVVVEGTLEGNTELDENGLVGYVMHRLVERSSSSTSGKRTHRWEFVKSEFALLNLQIEVGSLLVTAPGNIVAITGNAYEVVDTSTELPGQADTFLYNGQRLSTGAQRIRGVRNGDRVSIIGTRTGSGDLFMRRIHAGDRESFRAALEEESGATKLFGYGALGLGLLIVLISLIALGRRTSETA